MPSSERCFFWTNEFWSRRELDLWSFDIKIQSVCLSMYTWQRLQVILLPSESTTSHPESHFRRYTAKTTACSMSHARLYCNSVLYGCESEQTSTRSELRRANRNKDQTFRPRNSDPCRPTLVAGQVPNTVQGRSHRSIWLMSSGSMIRHVIYVPATETYYRRTALTSSSLIAPSLKPRLRCGAIYHSTSSQTFPI